MKKIYTYHSQEEMISSIACQIISIGLAAIEDRGRFSIALSGGNTPKPLYEILAGPKAESLDWTRVHFFWGDERCVPPNHPDSNFNQANQVLLRPRSILDENIHRIKAELKPNEAARQYQEEITSCFQGIIPRFDLILLGMGSDGHTASLFPGTDLVKGNPTDQNRLVAANWVPKLDAFRITFTHLLINAAHNVFFLVGGKDKAKILKSVLEGPSNPELYPSQLINPEIGDLTWHIDHEAGAELSNDH
jgi:6-phosphogluconolactonase